jgi:hypothetical protein
MPMYGCIGIFFHFAKNIMEKTPFYDKFPFGGEKKTPKNEIKKNKLHIYVPLHNVKFPF